MGMGFAGAYAYVVKTETIKTICPDEYQAFVQAVEASEKDEFEIADTLQYENGENEIEDTDVAKAYIALCKAFDEETGLGLGIGYHDSEGLGDRYDEVDGIYWYLDGLYVLSEEAKEFAEMGHTWKKVSFVQFG